MLQRTLQNILFMTVFIFTTKKLPNLICRVVRHHVDCSDVGLAINTTYMLGIVSMAWVTLPAIYLNIVDRLVLAGDGALIRLQ